MTRLTSILLLSYYLAANLLLPQGDFSALQDLPEMYRHCKATEDKDMTGLDFITDHLINVDCLFDKHLNGDEQKPHTPIQTHHRLIQSYFFPYQDFKIVSSHISILHQALSFHEEHIYCSDHHSFVFRPPIV